MTFYKTTTVLTALLLNIKPSTAAPAAVASSNPLRGGENLIGYSPTNTISDENTETISYQLAAGQTDAADLGVYLNFDDVENPQPIRGDTGGTDPGPRKFFTFLISPSERVLCVYVCVCVCVEIVAENWDR